MLTCWVNMVISSTRNPSNPTLWLGPASSSSAPAGFALPSGAMGAAAAPGGMGIAAAANHALTSNVRTFVMTSNHLPPAWDPGNATWDESWQQAQEGKSPAPSPAAEALYSRFTVLMVVAIDRTGIAEDDELPPTDLYTRRVSAPFIYQGNSRSRGWVALCEPPAAVKALCADSHFHYTVAKDGGRLMASKQLLGAVTAAPGESEAIMELIRFHSIRELTDIARLGLTVESIPAHLLPLPPASLPVNNRDVLASRDEPQPPAQLGPPQLARLRRSA